VALKEAAESGAEVPVRAVGMEAVAMAEVAAMAEAARPSSATLVYARAED